VFFPGFAASDIATDGATIHTLRGGSGPPLLLLHGHPQTLVCWHKIAGRLAEHFTVVLTDLRGYGDSSKPPGGERHVNYAPRAMARDQLEVMRRLGFARFAVAGHDRGGRVAHRMALDAPEAISKLAVLDIAPTLTMYARTDMAFATRYVWWFFQIQPYPIPEHLIGLDPDFYLREHLGRQSKTPGAVTDAALAEYLRCYRNPATIHAACEDYRAAAGIGLELDAADATAGRTIAAPCSRYGARRASSGNFTMSLRRGASAPATYAATPSTADTCCQKRRPRGPTTRCWRSYGRVPRRHRNAPACRRGG
jgi:haloacetate dehalogenase